jgi:hypothetical protein
LRKSLFPARFPFEFVQSIASVVHFDQQFQLPMVSALARMIGSNRPIPEVAARENITAKATLIIADADSLVAALLRWPIWRARPTNVWLLEAVSSEPRRSARKRTGRS